MEETIYKIIALAIYIGIIYWIYKKIKYRKYKKDIFNRSKRISKIRKQIENENNEKRVFQNVYNRNNEIKYRIIPNYRKKDYIMTYEELKFYKVLKTWAKEKNLTIFTQVVLYEILEPNTKQKWGSKYQSLLNKINRKSIDFTICEENGKILMCIELDDETHYQKKRIERDKFLSEIFKEAGLPLVHIKRSNYYKLEELENILKVN